MASGTGQSLMSTRNWGQTKPTAIKYDQSPYMDY